MASVFSLLLLLLCGATAAAAGTAATPEFPTKKTTHIHFYFHDLLAGPNMTSLSVAGLRKASHFGDIGVFDNLLTEGIKLDSKAVGRGQGVVVHVQLDGLAIMTAVNFVFTEGQYNGSSLAMFGRAAPSSEPNERPIVGGTGVFRGARGYSLSKVVHASPEYLIGEFDLYVLHH